MITKNDTVDLPLAGVESEHCALIVDKELAKVSGISFHKVELNNKKAIISTTSTDVIPQAVHAIRNLGYDVETVKQTFPVTGMSCASCAISTESIIQSQAGVINAAVNFANASVHVEYVPTITTPQQLKSAVQSVGYDLVIEDSKEAKEVLEDLQLKKLRSVKQRTIWSIIFSIPLVAHSMLFMNIPYANYIMWALATPCGTGFLGDIFFINAGKPGQTPFQPNRDTPGKR